MARELTPRARQPYAQDQATLAKKARKHAPMTSPTRNTKPKSQICLLILK